MTTFLIIWLYLFGALAVFTLAEDAYMNKTGKLFTATFWFVLFPIIVAIEIIQELIEWRR
ncbi:MAG: hypothetical protein COA52_01320 [Hyphomicrobiales bacterium]|nr:MAG: hypothetical protein COA52_00230 [Hyphomicrobiales bacterium]PCJ96872.1 MAG: hypothetical protein COA52_01320 [Hyphomicrobiales bacterium]